MIQRPHYIEQLKVYMDKPFVKILAGIRRAGKSTVFEEFAEYLKESGVKSSHIISMRFDSYEHGIIENGDGMYNNLRSKMKESGKYYLLLDEVQEVENWEKAVNALIQDCNTDVYVTGSNSKLMSSELSTYLTGRYISIPVYTLSFKEYIEFRKDSGDTRGEKELLQSYIRLGGFPAVSVGNFTQNEVYTIVRDIYNSVVYNDIVKRNNIRKTDLFERIVRYVFENVGKTFSAQSIAKYMKSEGRTTDVETVYNYIDMLKKAFIVYRANRYDIQGKEVLKTQEKYFVADPALKYSVLGFNATSVSAMLENIVYFEMLRRGFEVYVGHAGGKEIDFVGIDKDKKMYVQVCRQIPESGSGKDREIGNLQRIKDNHPKYVVTLDDFAEGNADGIKLVHLSDFLLGEWDV